MATRKTIASNLATILQAATFVDNAALKLFNLVHEQVPGETMEGDLPACLILVQDDDQSRVTDPVGAGLKQQVFHVRLHVFADAVDPADAAAGGGILDDILDGIDAALIAGPSNGNGTLNGAVSLAYETVRTEKPDPVPTPADAREPTHLLFYAIREFDAVSYITG